MKTILSFILDNHYEGIVSISVAVIYAVLSIAATIHILLRNYDIKSSIGWIAIVFLSPFLGTILYILFGINRVRRKAARLRSNIGKGGEFSRQEKENLMKTLPQHLHNIFAYGQNVYDCEFLKGNKVEFLLNGVEAYPQMIAAIKNAKKEVLIESYIFESDKNADNFIEAFEAAIKNGASVKVLTDGVGSLRFFRRSIEKKLSKVKGLKYGIFLPPLIPISFPFINLRNHRKLMIIDGTLAFFGGMNLSEKNLKCDDIENGVVDMTFRVEGAVIDQIAQIFEDDWAFVKGETFESRSNFIKYDNHKDGVLARVIPDGPDISQRRTQYLVCGALNFALHHIVIITPYFLPENDILAACEMAAMRGVNVEIILPGKNDHKFIALACEANFAYLIKKGIKIYRRNGPFDHSKLFIVDNSWALIGSANWDMRSFRLHFEATMEIFGEQFAEKALNIAEAKKADSRLLTLEECRDISVLKKLRDNALRLLTPYC
ncbi:MAG: cardiolipin synthase [Elusimicrobiota bacterium]|jgi:cardiolipin synthase|nr:cardiolipin synthase [Elusimicrobiota bacterium]